MKKFLVRAWRIVGTLAAIVVVHNLLGIWLEYHLTLRYLLLMLCTGGITWLNLHKLSRTTQHLFYGGFTLLLGGLIACWKLGEFETICKWLEVANIVSWEQRYYEDSLALLALLVALVSSVLPTIVRPSEVKQSTLLSRWFLFGAIFILDFAAAMPNTRMERLFYDVFYGRQPGEIQVYIANEEEQSPIALKICDLKEQSDTTLHIINNIWIQTDDQHWSYFGFFQGPRLTLNQHTVFWQMLKERFKKQSELQLKTNNND